MISCRFSYLLTLTQLKVISSAKSFSTFPFSIPLNPYNVHIVFVLLLFGFIIYLPYITFPSWHSVNSLRSGFLSSFFLNHSIFPPEWEVGLHTSWKTFKFCTPSRWIPKCSFMGQNCWCHWRPYECKLLSQRGQLQELPQERRSSFWLLRECGQVT